MKRPGQRAADPLRAAPLVLSLSLFVAVVVAGAIYTLVYRATVGVLTQQLLAASQYAGSNEVDIETQLLEFLDSAAATPAVQAALAKGDGQALFRTIVPLQTVANVGWLAATSPNGQAIIVTVLTGSAAAPSPPDPAIAGWQPVRQALSGVADSRGNRYAGVVATGSTPLLIAATAVLNAQGTIIGALVAGTPLSNVAERVQAGTAEQVTIYDTAGRVLATTMLTGSPPALPPDQLLAATGVTRRRMAVDDQPFEEVVGPFDVRGAPAGHLGIAVTAQTANATALEAALAAAAGIAIVTAISLLLGGRG